MKKDSKNKVIGYTAGVFDMFHIGHLNVLLNAKSMCDYLVVGVSTDELVSYKGKKPMIPYEERAEIVRNIKCVDAVVPQEDMEKLKMCRKLNAEVMFVGDDWYGTDKWNEYEKTFNKDGRRIVYFPYTKHISSTLLAEKLNKI